MKKYTTLKLIIVFLLSVEAIDVDAQKTIKFPELQTRIQNNTNDTVYVVNFWATWCAPCVKELPEFERLNLLYRNKKFKMLLVSLDFKKDAGRVRNFVSKNNLAAEIVLLDETKYHEWIDKIDSSWGGAIPATLILKNNTGFKLFKEQSLTFEQLESFIKPQL